MVKTIRKRFLFGGIIIAVTAIVLIVLSLNSAVSYYLTVGELSAQASALEDTRVRVSGKVAAGSIIWDARDLELRFNLSGEGETLPVVYQGVRPEGFKDDVNVLLDGYLDAGGIFRAGEILMKCPSKYEAEEQG